MRIHFFSTLFLFLFATTVFSSNAGIQISKESYTPPSFLSAQLKEEMKQRGSVPGTTVFEKSVSIKQNKQKPITLLSLSNNALSFSTMQGITYFSASRNRYRTLFYQSYFIDANHAPIPDPVFKGEAIPKSQSWTVFQEDSSFGKNYWTLNYRQTETGMMVTLENKEPIKKLGITAIKPGNIVFYIFVDQKAEGFQIYAVNITTPTADLFEKKMEKSLGNRLIAILRWFLDRNEIVLEGEELDEIR